MATQGQGQYLKQQQRLLPQQMQLMKLVEMPVLMLEQRIKEEIELNPALEEEVPGAVEASELPEQEKDEESVDEYGDETYTDLEKNDAYGEMDSDEAYDYSHNEERIPEDIAEVRGMPTPASISFHDYLDEQIGYMDITERQQDLARYLIGNIDEDGYLQRDLSAIADDMAFTQNVLTNEQELQEVLEEIQYIDPPGIGARNLKECLLIQLYRRHDKPEILKPARRIIEEYYDDFVKKHYEKLQRVLLIDEALFKEVIHAITRLNPKPGALFNTGSDKTQYITPDFIVVVNDNRIEVHQNIRDTPRVRVNDEYTRMLQAFQKSRIKNKNEKEATQYVKQKLDDAEVFISLLEQRQYTLQATMEAIVRHQREFFITGDETKMRPLILKDIADEIDMDISTISRVANSKYVQTESGIYPLKHFFGEGMNTESGEEVSTREVKTILKQLIEAEDKSNPLSDDELTDMLKQKGYNIARRTVAKYREQSEIPVSRLRKQI